MGLGSSIDRDERSPSVRQSLRMGGEGVLDAMPMTWRRSWAANGTKGAAPNMPRNRNMAGATLLYKGMMGTGGRQWRSALEPPIASRPRQRPGLTDGIQDRCGALDVPPPSARPRT